jgi:hypothetical protein
MRQSDLRAVPGTASRTATRSPGFLRRSRQILREAGAMIVNCLRRVGAPDHRAQRIGLHRAPRPAGAAGRRFASDEPAAPARRRAAHGRGGGLPQQRALTRSAPRHGAGAGPAAHDVAGDQPSDASIARMLRQHAFRIAQSADPVDALAAIIDLVIDSDADPYHLIGVLAEGALQTLGHRIPSERRLATAMALEQLMHERLRFAHGD